MVGRTKSEETIQIEKLFGFHLNQIVEDGKVLEPSNEIWSFLRNTLANLENPIKKTEKVIYTAALKWFNSSNKATKDESGNENYDSVKNISIETSLDASSSSIDRSPKKGFKKITIRLSPKVWHSIEPEEMSYKRKREGSHKTGVRRFVQLKPGLWTNIFANEIAKHDEIPCTWTFRRNKCYLSGSSFLVFEAKCKMCKAILAGSMNEPPEKGEIAKIDIEMHGIDLKRHTKEAKRVKLTSTMVKKICSQNKKATVIRRNMLKTNTKMFVAPRSTNMTADAIRSAQYRLRKKEKLSECPMTALTYLKASHLYMDCIQRIGLDPFYVIYCTPEQRKLFHAFSMRNKVFKVSCDATGSLVHKIGNFYILPNKSLSQNHICCVCTLSLYRADILQIKCLYEQFYERI